MCINASIKLLFSAKPKLFYHSGNFLHKDDTNWRKISLRKYHQICYLFQDQMRKEGKLVRTQIYSMLYALCQGRSSSDQDCLRFQKAKARSIKDSIMYGQAQTQLSFNVAYKIDQYECLVKQQKLSKLTNGNLEEFKSLLKTHNMRMELKNKSKETEQECRPKTQGFSSMLENIKSKTKKEHRQKRSKVHVTPQVVISKQIILNGHRTELCETDESVTPLQNEFLHLGHLKSLEMVGKNINKQLLQAMQKYTMMRNIEPKLELPEEEDWCPGKEDLKRENQRLNSANSIDNNHQYFQPMHKKEQRRTSESKYIRTSLNRTPQAKERKSKLQQITCLDYSGQFIEQILKQKSNSPNMSKKRSVISGSPTGDIHFNPEELSPSVVMTEQNAIERYKKLLKTKQRVIRAKINRTYHPNFLLDCKRATP